MAKYKVYITPHKTQLGQEAIRSLEYSKHFELVLDDCYNTVFDKGYAREVENRSHNCDLILATHDETLYKLRYNPKLIGPSIDTIEACRFKNTTYDRLEHTGMMPKQFYNGYPHPTSEDYPLFIKPVNGQGTRGNYCVVNKGDMLPKYIDEFLITEFLPGVEYTADCFTDRHGKLQFKAVRERAKITNGVAHHTKLANNGWKLDEDLRTISKILNMRGAWFAQFKIDKNGKHKLMECATRFAGSSGLHRYNNVNLVELSLWDKLEKDQIIYPQKFCTEVIKTPGKLEIKYVNNPFPKTIYVDLDDTLIFDGQIDEQQGRKVGGRLNLSLWSKLWRKKIEGFRIILLTKNNNPYKTLLEVAGKSYSLVMSVLDEIISVGLDESKDSYIWNQCIFIDDSHNQRLGVLTMEDCDNIVLSPRDAEDVL